jgi:diguanylate cyclase (GGDEF)-like protein
VITPIFILIGINAAIYILILYLLVTSLIHLKQKGLLLFLLATGALIIVRNAIHSLENQLGFETPSIRYELEQFAIAILALMLTIAIHQYSMQMRQQNGKLSHLLERDVLTNALSRFYIVKRAQEEIERARRTGRPLAVILIDLDHFKKVNDTYGHLAGDATLQCVVETCQSTLRKIDLLGRMGGDEFLALLPETSLEEAQEIAKRMIQKVNQSEIKISNNIVIKTSISIGIALYQPDHYAAKTEKVDRITILQQLLSQADEALYDVKENGRSNCSAAATKLQATF